MSEIKSEYRVLNEQNEYDTYYLKTSAEQVVGLGRMKSTAYSVGDVVYTDTNMQVALKCTTAGTTSDSELDISGNNVGQSVEDGSVVWNVIERNIAGGGVVTGNITVEKFANIGFRQIHPTTKVDLRFGIGTGGDNRGIYDSLGGWRFLLTGDGAVKIIANDNSESKVLALYPNGTFTFDDKDVLTASGLIDNADLNAITKAGTYLVRKGSATETQGWTSGIWGTNGFLEVFAGVMGTTANYLKQVYRRCGTSDSNDWQICTRQSSDGGATWGEWRRIDNGGEQRTLANTGYYKTVDGLVFAWTKGASTSTNGKNATVTKPIAFTTFIALGVDYNTEGTWAIPISWNPNNTTDTTDDFHLEDNDGGSNGFSIFWVGKAV